MKRCCLGFFCFLVLHMALANISKVIELQYRNANEILPLIQPLLEPGDRVSGEGQTLVVNVSADTLTKIRAVLHRLDSPPVSFRISVYQGDPDWLTTQRPGTRVITTNSTVEQQRYQSVQVTNGESALVSTGSNQPVVDSVGVGLWTGVSYQRHNVQNALLVEPLLQGAQVRLSVRRIRDQNSLADNQSFDEQRIATTMMVPLNQWVSLATAQGEAPADSNNRVIRAGFTYGQNSTLYIKVEIIDKQPAPDAK
ncbi:MAG: type II/III secretion system protein [Legionellaceae bacterium]|nr:type II/III secretion system protein [Legionellaceae bacterium]